MARPQTARKVRRFYQLKSQFQTERKRMRDCFALSARRLWRVTASMEHLGSFLIFERLEKRVASIGLRASCGSMVFEPHMATELGGTPPPSPRP